MNHTPSTEQQIVASLRRIKPTCRTVSGFWEWHNLSNHTSINYVN